MRDTKEELTCPACGKIMKKVFIPKNNFYIDVCLDGCGGFLFDNREFKRFDDKLDIKEMEFFELFQGKFEKVETQKVRICPVCLAKMVKNFTDVNKEVEIDECYSCGAKFFDCGEIQKNKTMEKTDFEKYIRDKFPEFFNS